MTNMRTSQSDNTSMTVQQAGRKGGSTTARIHTTSFYHEIGKRGGESRSLQLGKKGYQQLGRKGGIATAKRHSKKFYQEIGQKGGSVHKIH